MGIMISAMAAMIGAHGYTSSHGTQHAARIIREAGAARANPAAATKVEPNAEPSLPVPWRESTTPKKSALKKSASKKSASKKSASKKSASKKSASKKSVKKKAAKPCAEKEQENACEEGR